MIQFHKYLHTSLSIMDIIFTICSNNYLAQAKALGDSVLRHCGNYKFFIVLCDKFSKDIDYSLFRDFEIVEAAALGIKNFKYMIQNYNIVELNTSIKPFSFEYFYKNYNCNSVIYFDPDIKLFNSLQTLEEDLKDNNIILTPHICSPIEFDNLFPLENVFTNYGTYNLGFLATKKSQDTDKLISWWKNYLERHCIEDAPNGFYVDQLPMNLAPIFFEHVKITKNLGLNAAPWNLHERKLKYVNGKYFINDTNTPLIFYHFSTYNPLKPDKLSKYYTRAETLKDACLIEFYNKYREEILLNNWTKLSEIKYTYVSNKEKKQNKKGIRTMIRKIFNKIKCKF